MTFKEFMQENGYELQTTFWEDFSIADRFGLAAVLDTFNRAFREWKGDYKFLTELTLVLNHKIWVKYQCQFRQELIVPFPLPESPVESVQNSRQPKSVRY